MNTTAVNDQVLERFARLMHEGRLAHAYLFVGPVQTGKTQTALAVARLVNCEEPSAGPCGACVSCRKIISGNHPDIHVVNSDEGSIKIEQIRTLLGRSQLRPYEAKTKVFIIRDAQNMTIEAANALLKTLEEPSPNTLMILTTALPEANLDTIKSRCHTVQFFPVAVNRITQVLSDEGLSAVQARFLAVYTDGCLGQARALAQEGLAQGKNKMLDEILFNRHNDDYLKELAKDDVKAAQALQVLLTFFRDVLLLKSGAGTDMLVHQDRLKDLNTFAARSTDDLDAVVRHIVAAKRLIGEKLNVKVALNLLREYIWVN